MPPINNAAISAGVIVASVAVAAAIAIYESPELQRMANDLRRRIALALHSLGDGIVPDHSRNGEPLFNRPEDANGFFQSSEMDADDESRRRQREELLYWNAMKLSRELEKQTTENEKRKSSSSRLSSTTFDDFLTEDKFADEKGSYIVNSGTDLQNGRDEGLVRRRGTDGARGLNASLYANPFADEHGIDYDEQMEEAQIAPEKDEIMSQDIYNATPQLTPAMAHSRTMSPQSMAELVPVEPIPLPSEHGVTTAAAADEAPISEMSSSSELPPEYEYMTAGQDNNSAADEQPHDAYASIQAWAQQQQSDRDFYSPLPVTPTAPLSEMSDGELVSDGQLTPTDSASVAGSGIDVAHDAASSQNGSSKYYDVMSEDEDGVPTPAHSWTEVGSVVSESEDGHHVAQHA